MRIYTKDIVSGCEQIIAWLSGKEGDDYKQSYIYTYLMNKYDDDEDVAKSYAFRMLVHLIGDLVQPMHSMARFSSDDPKGDKGGNYFSLASKYGVKNLHSLWDKVLYKERNNIARPIKADVWEDFSNATDDLMLEYDYAVADPTTW